MLSPGTVLQGRYRVVRQLAKGGMGTVYEAVDQRLDTTVALKETSYFDDEALRRQFEREARLLARLHHPALPRVSDHFQEGDGQFLVMQFIPGPDLEEMRRAQPDGTFPTEQVLQWADQLLDALDYLHTQQPPVVHRDIKPQNLKLTARGQIILLDFGLAKGSTGPTSHATTGQSVYAYTREYASLEQLHGTGTDALSDLFSLAVTLYHLTTGTVPPNVLTRLAATQNGQPDPLRPAHELNPRVPSAVSAVLSRAMAVARSQRPASAAEMREELREAARRQDEIRTAPTVLAQPPAIEEEEREEENEREEDEYAAGEVDEESAWSAAAQGTLTETKKLQLEYWTAFRDYLRRFDSGESAPRLTLAKPLPHNWYIFSPFGPTGFRLAAKQRVLRVKWIGVVLILHGPDAKSHFHLLRREQAAIEKEIGSALEWREHPKEGQITLINHDADPTDRAQWLDQFRWLQENLLAFYRAFAPRIRNLKASDYVSGPSVEIPPAKQVEFEQAEQEGARTPDLPARLPELSTPDAAQATPSTLVPSTQTRRRSALLVGGLVALVLVGLVSGLALLYRSSQAPAAAVRVGSKDFTESIILGEMVAQSLEARGLRVERRFEFGGQLAHDALVAGAIDCYPEYTGTAFTAILKHAPVTDPRAVYEQTRREYAERFDVEVGPPLGFSNDFAILVRGADARRLNLHTISEAAPHARKWRAGFGQDFMTRKDGYEGFARAYGLQFAAPPREMDLSLTYRALAEGEVDVIAGNSTDGLIAALDLFQLEDDRHYFPPYEAVVLCRREALARHPSARALLAQLGGSLTTEEVRRLNYEIDGGKRAAAAVVSEWRRGRGF